MRYSVPVKNLAMEESLSSLITKVDTISIVLPERYPENWADIQNKGHRKYVYGGEQLNLALIVSFSEKNGQPAAEFAETWKSLSFASSAGYSSPSDSASGSTNIRPSPQNFSQQRSQSVDCPNQTAEADREERNPNQRGSRKGRERRFSESSAPRSRTEKIRCLSFTSVPVKEYEKAAKLTFSKKVVDVIPSSEGHALVLPMSVPLGALPEEGGASDSQIATVNIDISESRAISSVKNEEDRIDMLLRCPMEEVIQAEEKQHVIHNVSAEFPVLPPPQVNCQHFSVSGKHYLVTKVCNSYPEELLIRSVQVFVNKNSNLESTSASTTISSDAGDWSSFLSIELLPSQRNQSSTSLHPKEEHTFVFQVTWDCSLPSNRPEEPVQFPLFLVIEWSTPSMAMEQTIQSHYHLPTVTMDFPAFIVLAQCHSPVTLGQSFTVTYTLLNNLQDFLGITLIWIPDREPRGDICNESRVADRLVCQEPIKQLGPSKKGSTIKVPITFQALKAGIQELGKFMKLRLQYASKPVPTKLATSSLATPSFKPPLKSTHSSSSSSSNTSSASSASSSSTSSTTSITSSPSVITASASFTSLALSEHPSSEHRSSVHEEPEVELDVPVSKAVDASPSLPRRMFSIGPNSSLVRKGVFTRHKSLATPTSHPLKKFLAGIRSHSFSGESATEAGHQDDGEDNIQRERSSGSDPGIRPVPKKVQPNLSAENHGLSVDRISKHWSQVYITP